MLQDIISKLRYKDFPYVEIKTKLGSFVLQPSYFKGFAYKEKDCNIGSVSNEIYKSLTGEFNTVYEIIINDHVYDINLLLLSSGYDEIIELEHGVTFKHYKTLMDDKHNICVSYMVNNLVGLAKENNKLNIADVSEIAQYLLSMDQYTGEVEHWKANCKHPLLYDLTLCFVPKFTDVKPYRTVLTDAISIDYNGQTYDILHEESIGKFASAISSIKTAKFGSINTIAVMKTDELKKFNMNLYLPHLISTGYTLDFKADNPQCYEVMSFHDLEQQYKHLIYDCKHFDFGFMSIVHTDDVEEDEVYLVITGNNIESLSFSNEILRGELKVWQKLEN